MAIWNTMTELFLLMALGYGLAKAGMIDHAMNGKLSALVVNVSLPAMILASVFERTEQGALTEVTPFLLTGLGYYTVMVGAAWLFTRLLRVPEGERGGYQFMLIFSNCSFMGFPVMEAMYGTDAVFLSSILNLPFNLLAFSYGVFLLSRDGAGGADFSWKKLLSPGILASLLALVFFVLNVSLPDALIQTLDAAGGLTTPLSMLILGASLAEVPLREVFRDGRLYAMSFIRLLLLPLLTCAVMRLITTDGMLLGLTVVTAAMPAASMSVMLSSQYKGNTRLASVGVFLSTLFSVVTIPLVGYLLTILETAASP